VKRPIYFVLRVITIMCVQSCAFDHARPITRWINGLSRALANRQSDSFLRAVAGTSRARCLIVVNGRERFASRNGVPDFLVQYNSYCGIDRIFFRSRPPPRTTHAVPIFSHCRDARYPPIGLETVIVR